MSPGLTFERVYHSLKEQLGSGRFSAGEHLEPAVLSEDLCASITPVRDALHRLVGEGLVEAPRGDGFRTPIVTEVGLRHLYRWNATVLDTAARAHGRGGVEQASDAAEIEEPAFPAERFFLAIGARAGNPELVATIARLNDRLRPVRRVEQEVPAGLANEIADMGKELAGGQMGALRRSLAAYHRRRERVVDEIVAILVASR